MRFVLNHVSARLSRGDSLWLSGSVGSYYGGQRSGAHPVRPRSRSLTIVFSYVANTFGRAGTFGFAFESA